MKSKENKIFTKFYLLCFAGVGIMVLFFVYGYYFDIWGKKDSELPDFVNYIFYGFGISMLAFLILFSQFFQRNQETLTKEKKKKPKV